MLSNRTLLVNIKEEDDHVHAYSSRGSTHGDTRGTLENSIYVCIHKNDLSNILSYAKVWWKHRITYDDVGDIFTVHNPYKLIHFFIIKRGLYYHNCNPNGKKCGVSFVHTAKNNSEGFTKPEIKYSEKAQTVYNIMGRPSAADFERMVCVNMLKNFPITVADIKKRSQKFWPRCWFTLWQNSEAPDGHGGVWLCGNPWGNKIKYESYQCYGECNVCKQNTICYITWKTF